MRLLSNVVTMQVWQSVAVASRLLVTSLPQQLHMVGQEVVSGWNAAQGLPKPDIHALGRGGVMAFCAPNYLESELVEELRRLESDGVGEHLAKGFGQLTVCDPFHLNTGKVKQL